MSDTAERVQTGSEEECQESKNEKLIEILVWAKCKQVTEMPGKHSDHY